MRVLFIRVLGPAPGEACASRSDALLLRLVHRGEHERDVRGEQIVQRGHLAVGGVAKLGEVLVAHGQIDVEPFAERQVEITVSRVAGLVPGAGLAGL